MTNPRGYPATSSLTESQWQILKYVIPFQLLALVIITINAVHTFKLDKDEAMGTDKSLYLFGASLQGYWMFVVVRDLIISIGYF